jgi:hypothetical protein
MQLSFSADELINTTICSVAGILSKDLSTALARKLGVDMHGVYSNKLSGKKRKTDMPVVQHNL